MPLSAAAGYSLLLTYCSNSLELHLEKKNKTTPILDCWSIMSDFWGTLNKWRCLLLNPKWCLQTEYRKLAKCRVITLVDSPFSELVKSKRDRNEWAKWKIESGWSLVSAAVWEIGFSSGLKSNGQWRETTLNADPWACSQFGSALCFIFPFLSSHYLCDCIRWEVREQHIWEKQNNLAQYLGTWFVMETWVTRLSRKTSPSKHEFHLQLFVLTPFFCHVSANQWTFMTWSQLCSESNSYVISCESLLLHGVK